jgi:hypothetical protein
VRKLPLEAVAARRTDDPARPPLPAAHDRPYSLKECVACACERDDSAGLLVAEACATFCHGTLPCALPFKHDGDHSCRKCAADRAHVMWPALTVADEN